jgi:hypothetical protein
MKKSENNNLKDKFVCEFYSTLLDGITELVEGIELSSSSTESSESSSSSESSDALS